MSCGRHYSKQFFQHTEKEFIWALLLKKLLLENSNAYEITGESYIREQLMRICDEPSSECITVKKKKRTSFQFREKVYVF